MARKISRIGNKYMLEFLLDAKEEPGMTKKAMILKEGIGGDKTKYERVNNLIALGLLETRSGGKWNVNKLFLTPEGQMVAKSLEDIEKVLGEMDEKRKDIPVADGGDDAVSERSRAVSALFLKLAVDHLLSGSELLEPAVVMEEPAAAVTDPVQDMRVVAPAPELQELGVLRGAQVEQEVVRSEEGLPDDESLLEVDLPLPDSEAGELVGGELLVRHAVRRGAGGIEGLCGPLG